jgi:hypothetical protein
VKKDAGQPVAVSGAAGWSVALAVGGIWTAVEAHEAYLPALRRWLPSLQTTAGAEPQLRLSLELGPFPGVDVPPGAPRFGPYRAWRDAASVFVHGPNGVGAAVDLGTGSGHVWSADPSGCWAALHDCLRLPWFLALARRGVYPLHGSAVVVNGRALLIFGDSGAGKSTAAACLARGGAPLLADDTVFVVEKDLAIVGLGESIRLRCHGLSAAGRADAAVDPGGKEATTFGSTVQGPVAAGLIVLLVRGDQDRYIERPASAGDVMAYLMPSLDLALDPETAAGRLRTLGRLADSCPAIGVARPGGRSVEVPREPPQ